MCIKKTLIFVSVMFVISANVKAMNHESREIYKETTTMIKSIGLSWILVDDLQESVRFYSEIVGLKIMHFDEASGWAELSGSEDGRRFGIGQKSYYEEIHPGKNAIISLPVEDISKVKADLMKKGVKMLGDIIDYDGLKLQTFIDLDDNCFQLIQLTH
jgi:predicted enzyme related to lactoylglutathione lyase